MKEILWHTIPIAKVFSLTKSSRNGLTADEAKKRLEEFGSNVIPEKSPVKKMYILVSQLKSPLVYILLFAAIISLFLKSYLDLTIIMAVVVINTVIGFIQEYKANSSIAELKKMIRYSADVLRDGQEQEISIEQIVPGDIVFIKEGGRVPADCRLVEARNLEVVEAPLTGESTPSLKNTNILEAGIVFADRENMIYMGTDVIRGTGLAVVCETGKRTQIGAIASLISETREDKTPLQIKLSRLTQALTCIVIIVSIVVVIVGIIFGKPLFHSIGGREEGIVYTGISLAVAAIPEGLLVAVTVILAVGMKHILEKKALVRRLIAAETLGSTSVICTDKTGTLTEGKMRMSLISLFSPNKEIKFENALREQSKKPYDMIMSIAVLCNNAFIENQDKDITEWVPVGDSTETALLVGATQLGYSKDQLEKKLPRLDELPFSAEEKLMATLNALNEATNMLLVKGSPESVLARCKENGFNHTLKEHYERYTKQGLRVLAFAYAKTKSKKISLEEMRGLTFIGLIGLKDPLRKDAKDTFDITKKAGIKTIIVTGDHKFTAQNVAKEIGMRIHEDNIVEGSELDKMTDDELYKKVKTIELYARVSPHHKLRIIDAWQKRGEVVAMTGDGVNDAPALKSADIGVAFNSGTDVAKENADLVLLDNNFKTIVSAIEQGRIIFDNIRKVILYLVSDSFAQITLITAALVTGLPLPLIPVQILWINLIDDGLPALSFTMEKGEKDILLQKPRKKSESVMNLEVKLLVFFISVAINIPLFFVYYIFLTKLSYPIDHVRTIIFTSLAVSTLLYSFSCRTLRKSILHKSIFSNKYLIVSVLIGFCMQLLAVYEPHLQKALRTVPLGSADWGIIFAFSFLSIFIIEVIKIIFIIKDNNRHRENVIQ